MSDKVSFSSLKLTSITRGSMLLLEGEHFSLRTMTAEDITDEYISWLEDEKVHQFLEVRHKIPTKDEAILFLKKFDQNSSFAFIIQDNNAQRSVGTITLYGDLNNKSATYGYIVGDKNYWGTKAAVESIELLLDFAFFQLGLRRVGGAAYTKNIGSIFNFKKLGFIQEGRIRSAGVINGKEMDIVSYGILKSEWEARKK